MNEILVYRWLLWAWFALPVIIFVSLFFVTAPYGRHAKRTGGPSLPAWLGWVVMESPSVIAFAACWLFGRRTPVTWAFFALWQLHYVNRTYIFPFRMRGASKPMPLGVIAGAFFFTLVNGYLNGRWLTAFGPALGTGWLTDPRFVAGAALFLVGFAINQHADRVLFHLRAPGETGYKIPRGGLYRWVSCPNYLGEIIEWSGWALATWSPAGLAFALWTVANLLPRARAHHRWYRAQFPDYPTERRALVPLVF